ncbi:MAG: hypothetical protein L0Y74_09160 [candidate division Zixibacteria bacterium]|nr:hypothetical protein [candidate division Zixibacteria bacterium]MCI0532100.1 hypothetical protein [candidate division Zixibacteria bacterium]
MTLFGRIVNYIGKSIRLILRGLPLIMWWPWKQIKRESLWSGLFPTILLAIFAGLGLYHTNQQVGLLREQLSYTREPIMLFYTEPVGFHSRRVWLFNVGNDTAENINVRFGLFLVNENQIFSYSQLQNVQAYFTDSTRPPKAKLFSQLSIPPNGKFEISERIHPLFLPPIQFNPVGDFDSTVEAELFRVKDLLKGEFVLFAECSYRRKSDFVKRVDTSFFWFFPRTGPEEDLKMMVSGIKVIDRLKDYLKGPQLIIQIFSDRYIIFKSEFGVEPKIIRSVPRKI